MTTVRGRQAVQQKAKEHLDNVKGMFAKLADDGDSITVAFVGDEVARETVWTNGKTEEYDPHKHAGMNPSLKIRINVYTRSFQKKGGGHVDVNKVQIYDMGVKLYNIFLEKTDQYGRDKYWYIIQRHGAAKSTDTTYSIERAIVDDKVLVVTDQDRADMHKLELFNLEHKDDDDSGSHKPAAQLDPSVLSQLTLRLKSLSNFAEEGKNFCANFKIAKIKDLTTAQLNDASAWIAAREALASNGQATQTEIDPFA